jgi:hypothetical protein
MLFHVLGEEVFGKRAFLDTYNRNPCRVKLLAKPFEVNAMLFMNV